MSYFQEDVFPFTQASVNSSSNTSSSNFSQQHLLIPMVHHVNTLPNAKVISAPSLPHSQLSSPNAIPDLRLAPHLNLFHLCWTLPRPLLSLYMHVSHTAQEKSTSPHIMRANPTALTPSQLPSPSTIPFFLPGSSSLNVQPMRDSTRL